MKVLITGTSRGIGKAIAELFLNKGHEVIGFDIKEATILTKGYTHYRLDVAKDPLPELSDVAILINNAGVQEGDPIEVNLRGSIRVSERYAFSPAIRSVLFIASASASTGAEFPEYAASKGGVVTYMKNLASRLAPKQATVNSLSPGGVNNELNQHILNDPSLYEQVLQETMLHRWSEVEEIAEWAYFLTVTNRSMTAQDVLVDNGEAAKFNFVW